MHATVPRLRAAFVAVAAVGLVAVAGGGTLAASNPTTLYACYDPYGNVKVTDIPQCKLTTGGRLVPINVAGTTGPAGPTGASGGTGPTGPTGPAGASVAGHAYQASANVVNITTGPSVFPTTVTSLDLPAGKYVVMASGTVVNQFNSLNWVTCSIVDGGPIATQQVQIANENRGAYSMVGTVDLVAPATVQLQCSSGGSPEQIGPAVDSNHLVAWEVGAIN